MMKILKHALFIIGGFFIIYLLALVAGAFEHQTKLNGEVLDRVGTSKNYDEWLSYQTHLYKHVDMFTSLDNAFQIDIYATVEAISETEYVSNFYVFLMPLVAVDYAQTLRDNNDLMRFIISNETNDLLDTDRLYRNEALSYGLHPKKLGFVFQGIELEAFEALTFKIYDYHGDLIIDHALEQMFIDDIIVDYDALNIETYIQEQGYIQGKTGQEISQILNPRIQQSVFFYVSLYFGAVALGYVIFYSIKIIKTKKDN